MRRVRLDHLTGLAGVAPRERPEARRWARRFEWPMLAVAVWIPVQWYLEQRGAIPPPVSTVGDWLVWLVFVAETAVLTALVRDRRRYLLTNWMNLAIIALGVPLLWGETPLAGALRGLRLLLLVGILARLSRSVRAVLARNRLGPTLAFSAVVLTLAGVLISGVDPAIGSAWDGIWWAWVTVTTVGYGDVVPSTPAGRFIASLVMLLGLGLFALLAANVSAFLIGRDVHKVEREESDLRARLEAIEARLVRIERALTRGDRRRG